MRIIFPPMAPAAIPSGDQPPEPKGEELEIEYDPDATRRAHEALQPFRLENIPALAIVCGERAYLSIVADQVPMGPRTSRDTMVIAIGGGWPVEPKIDGVVVSLDPLAGADSVRVGGGETGLRLAMEYRQGTR